MIFIQIFLKVNSNQNSFLRQMFKIMNCGYSIKNSKYPIDHLLSITLLNSRLSLEKYLKTKLIAIDLAQGEEHAAEEYLVFSKINNQNYELNEKKGNSSTMMKKSSIRYERESLIYIDNQLNDLDESDFIIDSRFV
jgi:hypothetical protein